MSDVTFSPPIGYLDAASRFKQLRGTDPAPGDVLGFDDNLELVVLTPGSPGAPDIEITTNLLAGDGAGGADDSGIDPADVAVTADLANMVVTSDLAAYVPITREVNSHFLSGDINLTTGDINSISDKRYVTDAQLTVLGNTSGTNTGDQTTVSGNAGTATKWQTARTLALTGDVTYTSGSFDGSGNATGTATLANIPAIAGTNLTGTAASLTAGNVTTIATATTHASDLTAVPLNLGGWVEYFVTGSPATTTGQSLVDITGLVTGTLSNSTLYEFQATLFVTTSAVSTGINYGIHGGGTGSAATVNCLAIGTSTQNAVATATIRLVDTATANYMTTSGSSGTIYMRGWFTSMSTGTATMSVQHLKVTSGTSTVNVGSVLRIRKAHT